MQNKTVYPSVWRSKKLASIEGYTTLVGIRAGFFIDTCLKIGLMNGFYCALLHLYVLIHCGIIGCTRFIVSIHISNTNFMTHTQQTALTTSIFIVATVATLLFATGITTVHAAPSSDATKTNARKSMSTTTLTCMQGLVDTREDAIIAAFTKFSTDTTSALTARKNGLHSAWGLSAGNVSASSPYKSTWTTWKTASKKAHTDLKNARKAAWETFRSSAKNSCDVTLPEKEKLEKDKTGSTAL